MKPLQTARSSEAAAQVALLLAVSGLAVFAAVAPLRALALAPELAANSRGSIPFAHGGVFLASFWTAAILQILASLVLVANALMVAAAIVASISLLAFGIPVLRASRTNRDSTKILAASVTHRLRTATGRPLTAITRLF